MLQNRKFMIGIGILITLAIVVVVTAVLVPEQLHPAYDVAVVFANAVGKGDEATAFAQLDAQMQAYMRENCPDGAVTACVSSYIPAEWGEFLNAVFRRATPDPDVIRDGVIAAYDIDVIATHVDDKGGSGVCTYLRMEMDDAGAWKVAGYAGFISCGDPASRNMATNPDTPNRAP